MSSANLPPIDLISSLHKEFRNIDNLKSFAALLTKVERDILFQNSETKPNPIKSKHLLYLSKHANSKYKVFTISKKSGGERKIEAPEPFLKRIQSTINVLFQVLFFEKINYHTNGFILNRNINRNALPHIQKKFVLNIDIEDFFPSIEFRRIKTVLEFEPFNLSNEREAIGFIISNICCRKGKLPQGAPTSPILSNIVTQRLDRRISKLASKYKVKYSRYADDLSFSANRNVFEKGFLDEVRGIIEGENFKINNYKTRVKSNRDHQEVTGIVVNQKLNVRRSYIKVIRTMINNWEKGGLEYAKNEFHFNEPHKTLKNFQNVLGGRIGYIGVVRGTNDPLFQRLNMRFSILKHKVDYSNISDDRVKQRLIRDNEKMEKILLDIIHESESKYISFCTSAFHQIENLVNYFYWKRFPKMEDLLQYLLNENPAFKTKYKNLENCKGFKRIGQLDINVLVYLFEKEFYFSKGVQYRQELTMLRDIRNDNSHRCEVESFDQNAIIEEYERLKKKWAKFLEKHQGFPIKPKDEEEIEYKYRLIMFLRQENYNTVRKTLKKSAQQIQEYHY